MLGRVIQLISFPRGVLRAAPLCLDSDNFVHSSQIVIGEFDVELCGRDSVHCVDCVG